MLHQLAETRRRFYTIAYQEKLTSRESIYYSLSTMIEFGLRISENSRTSRIFNLSNTC